MHVPLHVPPQPSDEPQRALGSHWGTQTQVPTSQRLAAAQPPGQLHVSTHVPLTQVWPLGQVTPAQRLTTHLPLEQN